MKKKFSPLGLIRTHIVRKPDFSSLYYFFSLEGLGQINDVIKDATNKLGVLSKLRCLAEVKHFKSVEEDDDGLNSEIVRRTALIQGNTDLDFYTSQ